jgi:hypothetical protein
VINLLPPPHPRTRTHTHTHTHTHHWHPRYPDQGATSTFFTAAQPGIEDHSGALIDFDTKVYRGNEKLPWQQSGETCTPRVLPPPWTDTERVQWYDAVQKMLLA